MAGDDNMIAALKRERATYVARGDDDRVRQVDEQLKHYGYKPDASDDDGPQGRTGPDGQQHTADATGSHVTTAEPLQDAPAAKKTAAKKTAAPKPQE